CILSFKIKGKGFFKGVLFFPHLVCGIAIGFMFKFFCTRGFVLDTALGWFGINQNILPYWLRDARVNNIMLAGTSVWRYLGQNMVLFIGAISSIDPVLYEAAEMDGANRWQRMWKIDFAMLLPTACVLLIMRAGSIMNVGFEKVYLMQNNLNLIRSEVISTYVYKIGIINQQYSYSSAINLFNTMVNLILLLIVNNF
ncbi:MAG: ABC transporter permease subunit, partial [Treponema sp.]|nr:ABC transporter permease subunit [Treponema sp.]